MQLPVKLTCMIDHTLASIRRDKPQRTAGGSLTGSDGNDSWRRVERGYLIVVPVVVIYACAVYSPSITRR